MIKPSILSVVRLVLGILALTAIGRQLVIQIQQGASLDNFFSYFTNLSNLFAAVVLLLGAQRGLARREVLMPGDQVRLIPAVSMAVVGIVFTVLLRSEDLGALRPWVNFVLHDLMPCAVVLDWLLEPPSVPLGLRHLMRCLIFPALYLVYSLARGSQVGWYPYPFLNPDRVGGYGAVAGYAVGIAATFLVAGGLLLTLGNWLRRSFDSRRGGANTPATL